MQTGFAINWLKNQVTKLPQFRDLTHMLLPQIVDCNICRKINVARNKLNIM